MEIDLEYFDEFKHIEICKHIKDCLGMDYSQYEAFRTNAIAGMALFGDLFATKLAEALDVADISHSIKIIRYWYTMIEQYVILHRMALAKIKAESENANSTAE